jgi:hypothetical protein
MRNKLVLNYIILTGAQLILKTEKKLRHILRVTHSEMTQHAM